MGAVCAFRDRDGDDRKLTMNTPEASRVAKEETATTAPPHPVNPHRMITAALAVFFAAMALIVAFSA